MKSKEHEAQMIGTFLIMLLETKIKEEIIKALSESNLNKMIDILEEK